MLPVYCFFGRTGKSRTFVASISDLYSNHWTTVLYILVEMTGIEPATFYLQSKCSTDWATSPIYFVDFGVADRIWTCVIRICNPLPKPLSHSHIFFWVDWRESNPQPFEPQSNALPIELQSTSNWYTLKDSNLDRRIRNPICYSLHQGCMVHSTGLEPVTDSLEVNCSNPTELRVHLVGDAGLEPATFCV